MSIKIYHQVGHNSNWNIESFTNDRCGDGLILSPVHQPITAIQKLSTKLKQASIFDPQYYLPNSQKKKLATYNFFPEVITGGFLTTDFHLLAHQSAEQCVDFQVEQNFNRIIVPTRYIDQMKTNYFDQQNEYSLKPFLKVINAKAIDKPIFITLALTSYMIEDEGFCTKILNWVTGFPEITGVYVLVSHERDTKQIKSETFLKAYFDFLTILRSVDLEVIAGHMNTESLLFSLIDDITLTFGTFENTRMFSVDKFVENEEDRRGPKARIYLPSLLNWIQFNQAQEIRKSSPSLWASIYTQTEPGDLALNSSVEPTFNQPPLYKHHFICLNDQVRELGLLSQVDRYMLLKNWIQAAKENFERINKIHVSIENHGNGKHLPHWENVIDYVFDKYLKA